MAVGTQPGVAANANPGANNPADIALEAYERALQPKRLLMLDGGHFDPYTGDLFKQNSAAQRDWFTEHLKP
jgi:hypothetical protein